MKIVNDDVTLRLVDDRRPLGNFCWLWAALAIGFGAYQILTEKTEMLSKNLLSLSLFVFVFASFPLLIDRLAWVHRDFQFDKNSRVLTWQRRTLFTKKGGTVPFSAIKDVSVEAMSVDSPSSGGGTIVQHRLVLNTTEGKLEVTHPRTLSVATVQKQCDEAIVRIRDVLRNPKA